jgi:hypothetical protein
MKRSAVAGQSSTNPGINVLVNPTPVILFESDQKDDDRLDLVKGTSCGNDYKFTPGCAYEIKKYDKSGHSSGRCRADGSVKPGNYMAIEKSNAGYDSGKNFGDSIEAFAIGLDRLTACDLIQTKDESDENVACGVNTRFGQSTHRISSDRAPADANVKSDISYSTYKSGTNVQAPTTTTPGVPNRRVLIIPIADLRKYVPNSRNVQISRYAAFFLNKEVSPDGTMQLEFINDTVVVGDGSYDPSIECPGTTSSGSNVTVTVLYR